MYPIMDILKKKRLVFKYLLITPYWQSAFYFLNVFKYFTSHVAKAQ